MPHTTQQLSNEQLPEAVLGLIEQSFSQMDTPGVSEIGMTNNPVWIVRAKSGDYVIKRIPPGQVDCERVIPEMLPVGYTTIDGTIFLNGENGEVYSLTPYCGDSIMELAREDNKMGRSDWHDLFSSATKKLAAIHTILEGKSFPTTDNISIDDKLELKSKFIDCNIFEFGKARYTHEDLLSELGNPLLSHISKLSDELPEYLKISVKTDANTGNWLVKQKEGKIVSIRRTDFGNISNKKHAAYDLAHLLNSEYLGMPFSDSSYGLYNQKEFVIQYVQEVARLKGRAAAEEDIASFLRLYDFVSILRNLTLTGADGRHLNEGLKRGRLDDNQLGELYCCFVEHLAAAKRVTYCVDDRGREYLRPEDKAKLKQVGIALENIKDAYPVVEDTVLDRMMLLSEDTWIGYEGENHRDWQRNIWQRIKIQKNMW